MSFIYLASPYTHDDPRVMQDRFEAAERKVAHMLRERIWVYSPIVHCHDLALKYRLPAQFAYWQSYNKAMLHCAREVWVLMLPGWEHSKGVEAEIRLAAEFDLITSFVRPS